MVSVKATYGRSGELRRLSFPDGFPTYEQLYNQLYRVFPISHTYFLSNLLFSPDSSKASVQIAVEVHTAEQYAAAIAPYASKTWSNPMLRFTVFDETPHKFPAGFVPDDTSANLSAVATPFISVSHIPPPPIILSSAHNTALDIDSPISPDRFSQPQHQHVPQSAAQAPCCAVTQGKIEMEGIISKFKQDLDLILKTSLGTPSPTVTPAPSMPSFTPPSSFCLFKYCSTCARIFQGPWFACEKCSTVLCSGCHENQTMSNNFCVAAMAPHVMKKEFCAACPPDSTPQPAPPAQFHGWPLSYTVQPQQQGYSPAYPFGAPAPVVPFIPPPPVLPYIPAPAPSTAASLPFLHEHRTVVQAPEVPAPPVIHRGVICDICDDVVEGIRHKCLDCPNYDLCTKCITSGGAERHNAFHEFLEIKEPGRVIVHTVYSGEGERATPTPARETAPNVEEQPAAHYATCNMCDSRIRGDRYKCAVCPDFDTCSGCFSITREQHPYHAFVKLSKASDYIRRDAPVAQMHLVTCDSCRKRVYGIRYKCMHPECPDFDLCENCEALPIPVHPDNHPLLKMRSPNTVVPTVYRVGQTTLIKREEPIRVPASPPRGRSRSRSFERGYMANPNSRSHTMPATFFESIPPPSPFFFRSESSRSSSPVTAYNRPVSPLFAPRPSSQLTMPGGLYGPGELNEETAYARQLQPPISYPQYQAAPQRAVSRFSHSPSPSPPLFRDHTRSPSPEPAPGSRLGTFGWAPIREYPRCFGAPPVPVQAQQMYFGAPPVPVQAQQMHFGAPVEPPVPVPAVPEPTFPSFWPKSSEDLRHLMQHEQQEGPVLDAFSRLTVHEEEEPAEVMDSPLTGEALLSPPAKVSGTTFSHSLAALLNGYESEAEQVAPAPASFVTLPDQAAPAPASFVTLPEPAAPAPTPKASFVNDVTLPDGQTFPPGAEFMKCWQMVNSGEVDWPAETKLVYVAGERLTNGPGPASVVIGPVKVGAQVELWTPELKAPEATGRYVSYWRLRDGEGVLFGDSIWIDINVTETQSNGSSLGSSSIIVMPPKAGSSVSASASAAVVVEESSDDESDASSVSLMSVPSEDEEEWASVAAAEEEPQAQRYVVLYDDASSEEEE